MKVIVVVYTDSAEMLWYYLMFIVSNIVVLKVRLDLPAVPVSQRHGPQGGVRVHLVPVLLLPLLEPGQVRGGRISVG